MESNQTIPKGEGIINNNAFSGCMDLESVVISEGVEVIGKHAFWDCRNLCKVILPDSLKEIGDYAFERCYVMESISIPKSVINLDGSIFPGSSDLSRSALRAIQADDDNLNYASVDGVLYSKDLKKLIAYPAGKEDTTFFVPETVETIGRRAFSGCFNLKEVVLGDKCSMIEEEAFEYCKYLEKINLFKVRTIQRCAFQYCESLKMVELDGLNIIESSCFHGCTRLSEIHFGKVETVKDRAFIDCKALAKVEIPDTLSTIEDCAFNGSSIQNMTIPKTIQSVGMCSFGGVKCISFYDNLQGNRLKVGKPFGTSDAMAFDVTVLDSIDDTVKYIAPFYCDGSWQMKDMLNKALKEDNSFDFSQFDSYFSMIKDKNMKPKVAVFRLLHPYDLSEYCKRNYEEFLKNNAPTSIKLCIESKDVESFKVLFSIGLINSRNINKYKKIAKEKGAKDISEFLDEVN